MKRFTYLLAAALVAATTAQAQVYRGNNSPYRPHTGEEEYFNRAVPPVPIIPHSSGSGAYGGGGGYYEGGYSTRDLYTGCVNAGLQNFCVRAYRRLCTDENEFNPHNRSCVLLRQKMGRSENEKQ